MIDAWIVVHEDDRTDNAYRVFLDKQKAIDYADTIAQREAADCALDEDSDVDRECYDNLAYHYHVDDAFRVSVEPVKIQEAGDP